MFATLWLYSYLRELSTGLRDLSSVCETSGSHGGEYEDDSIIALMMETVRTFETSVYFN
jgi:hypothetical protein